MSREPGWKRWDGGRPPLSASGSARWPPSPLGLVLVRLVGDSATQAGLERSSLPEAGPVALYAGITLLGGLLGAVVSARRDARLDPSTALRGT